MRGPRTNGSATDSTMIYKSSNGQYGMAGGVLLLEGCLGSCRWSSQPRAQRFVAAARVKLVSIQSIYFTTTRQI